MKSYTGLKLDVVRGIDNAEKGIKPAPTNYSMAETLRFFVVG
jgi:hypothetical protein